MTEPGPDLRFVWLTEAGPVEVTSLPPTMYKFIVLYTADYWVVIAGDETYQFHRDLHGAVPAEWRDAVVVGGGCGGADFPGTSTRYGAAPPEIVERIRAVMIGK